MTDSATKGARSIAAVVKAALEKSYGSTNDDGDEKKRSRRKRGKHQDEKKSGSKDPTKDISAISDEEHRRLNNQRRETEYQARRQSTSVSIGAHSSKTPDDTSKATSPGAGDSKSRRRNRNSKAGKDQTMNSVGGLAQSNTSPAIIETAQSATAKKCDTNEADKADVSKKGKDGKKPVGSGGLLRLSASLRGDPKATTASVGGSVNADNELSSEAPSTKGSQTNPTSASSDKIKKNPIPLQKVAVQAPKREPREGVDFPRQRKKHDPLTLTMTAEELVAQKEESQRRDVERKWQYLRTCEVCFQKAFEELRQNRTLLQDFCLMGPALGAPELHRQLCAAESSYLDLLRICPNEAISEKVPQKVWTARQKLLEVFQSVLAKRRIAVQSSSSTSAGGGGGGSDEFGRGSSSGSGKSALAAYLDGSSKSESAKLEKKQLHQIGSMYLQELNSTIQSIRNVLTLINIDIKDTDGHRDPVSRRAVHDSICCLCMSLGDLHRYKEAFESKSSSSSSGNDGSEDPSRIPHDQETAKPTPDFLSYYNMALQLAPWNGLPYKHFASLAHRKGDIFQAAYLLLRSMCVEQPYDGREPLLSIFDSGNDAAEKLTSASALSALSIDEHRTRFRTHILASTEIAYSRTGADKLAGHVDKARRHLASLLQMLAIEATNANGASVREGQFYEFGKGSGGNASTAGGVGGRHAGNITYMNSRTAVLIADIDDDAYHTVVVCLALLHNVATKNSLKETVYSSSWNEAVTDPLNLPSPPAACAPVGEEEAMYAKRYVSKRLHTIQCIPGLVDVVRLTLGLLTTLLLSGCEASSGSSAQRGLTAASVARIAATSRAISVFLAWLESNKEYHVAALIDRVSWDQFEAAMVGYFDALRTKPLVAYFQSAGAVNGDDEAVDISVDSALYEDHDLVGFLPLQESLAARSMSTVSIDDSFSEQLRQLRISEHNPTDAAGYQTLQSQEIKKQLEEKRLNAHAVLTRSLRIRASVFQLAADDVLLGNAKATGKVAIAFEPDRSPLPAIDATESSSPQAERLKVLNIQKQLAALQNASSLSEKTSSSHKTGQQKRQLKGGSMLLSAEEFIEATSAISAATKPSATEATNSGDDDEVEGEIVVFPGRSIPGADQALTTTATKVTTDDVLDEMEPASSLTASPQMASESRKGGLLKVPTGAIPHPQSVNSSNSSSNNTKKGAKTKGDGGKGQQPRDHHRPSNSAGIRSFLGKKGTDVLPLIVIDAPNVAMRHGMKARFSCRGVKLAIDFFLSQGHKVVSFLPDYYLDYERVGELRRVAKLGVGNVRESQIPDDISLLRAMVEQGHIVGTPPQDYDDSYCITYARRHAGYVITNDMYRDHIGRVENPKARDELRTWIKSHCISYTFVGDEFLPNPDASFEKG